MRLIDADAVEKITWQDPSYTDPLNVLTEVREKVRALPTIDAVPVVRCKDCKHYYEKEWVVGGGSYTSCWYQTIANAQPNDFCSRAERRDK